MTIPPIRRQIVVDATPDRSYRAWHDEIGSWWPLARFSVYETGNTVAFVGDDIVETSATGETNVWGSVLEADPPHRLRFSWHPGSDGERGVVDVAFSPIGDGRTLVTLEHSGWEAYADLAEEARAEYRGGWPGVLAGFGAHASGPAPAADGDAWFVLSHTPGAAAGAEGVFSHPLFAEHAAFLRGLADEGVLIAAGPLPDEPGAGQTVIRVPAARAAEFVARAEADGSVAGDLLVVRVRPWDVMMAG
jgi:uncharacterized protein YndB with AHSA1/START domain/uncharacterized protein YciI